MSSSSTYDMTLLPAADEAPRCSVHASDIAVDPGGSALWVDEVVLVDVPLPWPKPVWAADGFAHVPDAVRAAHDAGRRVRVLAAAPLADGIGRIVSYVRVGEVGAMVRSEFHVAAPELGSAVDRLVREGPGSLVECLVESPIDREVAICAQGSHDICCGSEGMRLASVIEAVRPGVSVRRVSHTGGHRFSPTGITFPDGRMWGFVTVEEMAAILDRDGSPAAVAPRCRGWTGADPIGQVAERAVFALLDDWAVDDLARDVIVEADDEGWLATVHLAGRTFLVMIEAGRAVPTIACRALGGLPAKPGREYRVTDVREI